MSAGSASLPSPCTTKQHAGNMEAAHVQGGLWAKQTSHPRSLLLCGFRLSPAQKQVAPLKQKTLPAFWMLHIQKGDRDLNPEYSVLLFKTQLTGTADRFYLVWEPDLCWVRASVMESFKECKLHF